MKLDPLSLRLFVSVVEEGTIAAAATREHIAAAAVSKRLSELEDQLNTQLLTRSNKGITVTAAGVALLNLARGVLNDLDNIVSQMQDFSSGTRGSVRVLANISAITQFMPAALQSFLAKHPLVQVNLQEKVSTAVIRGVAENIADIGIFTQVPYGDNLEVHRYRNDELVLIVPANHPLSNRSSVSFAETLDFEFVGLHVGSSLNFQMIKAASELGRSLKLRIQVTSYDAQCLMVEAGLGIGLLPKISVDTYNALAIKTVGLDEPWAHRQLDICVRSYDSLSVAAKLLFNHFQSNK
ncbi:MAG TPA: LysR family transcriptional regulator [Polaromonas sp.]|jgi:DNA-binding transcriptional LysR family regulator|uniref:LysR family transcriptional regulator n=1 Tax=Polaromonas sp. UBA4122 TaxID=1947074 RepID=UPI000EB9566F|nr:LysR family transcriptional regulator [Polaromonas sp. UBA4122]HAL38888.1 LysR family transcriptional regulator [Polaromonas sp.]